MDREASPGGVPAATPRRWSSLDDRTRRRVLELAKRGEQHSDPEVVAAASEWAHDRRWNDVANRLPGWLLPLVGTVFAVGFLLAGVPLLAVASVLVALVGAAGWVSTTAARRLRRIYPSE